MTHITATRRSLMIQFPEGGRKPVRAIACALLAALLAGCAAGPDFERPAPPDVGAYTATPPATQTASSATALGQAQRIGAGSELSAQWWRTLGSASLDAWIEQALQASPTLASAQAALRQAQELRAAQAGSTLYPQVDAGVSAQRQRLNPSAQGQPGQAREFDLYSASLGVHYRLDLSGGNRRALEALAARTEYRRHELRGARLALTASITTTAIARARLAGQIAATQAMVQAQDEQLALTQERVRLGHAAPDDVLALRTQAEQTRAGLPPLRKQLDQSEHLLATLAGQPPGAANVPAFTLEEFSLPTDLPLVLPSELVRRRPDILGAEALLHASTAEYGVAVAKLYPQLNLSASLGSQALSARALFGGATAAWSLLAQLTQPLFNPGLPAEKRAALAAVDAAAANYQGVVLNALRDVSDVLRALEHDAQALASLASADAAAQASLDSVRRQYGLGTASYLQTVIARQQAQQIRIGLIAAQAQRLVDSAALHQALGGGYVDESLGPSARAAL